MIQQRWSSHFNFIMVTAGAAVGLGPIWKFPYMAGANGGGAFVLVLVLAMFATIGFGFLQRHRWLVNRIYF